jgi:hypothetical protein
MATKRFHLLDANKGDEMSKVKDALLRKALNIDLVGFGVRKACADYFYDKFGISTLYGMHIAIERHYDEIKKSPAFGAKSLKKMLRKINQVSNFADSAVSMAAEIWHAGDKFQLVYASEGFHGFLVSVGADVSKIHKTIQSHDYTVIIGQ